MQDFLLPLQQVPHVKTAFVERMDEVPTQVDRDEAMRRLRPYHSAVVENLGFSLDHWWRAEQVHGAEIGLAGVDTTIPAADGLPVIPGVDGLITQQTGLALSIYVADCGVIWLADPTSSAIGLLHSGKKGTEANILGRAVAMMQQLFGTRPENLIAVLGPCIRPPHYEVDFAATIADQARAAGIGEFHDAKTCTASDLPRFYSYRKELGHTGRMMAVIGSIPPP
jgi:copper oxidase (laccase) domain-containing protein